MRTVERLKGLVPARVGGVDLSNASDSAMFLANVPARVGGVDLSSTTAGQRSRSRRSPPVWAGWI